MNRAMAAALGIGAAGAACVAWGFAEAHAFTTRRVTVPLLAPGSAPVRVLHLSDLHLTPGQRDKIAWTASLAHERPDLVVVTGDNLAHVDAVPALAEALASLLTVPGLFVFGSNDYYAPHLKNPFGYFAGPSKARHAQVRLPTERLRSVFLEAGWHDLNNARAVLDVGGLAVSAVGMDDPHIERDRMPSPDTGERGQLHLGVVHAPYRRALQELAADGADLMLAGHTHGGQVCVPGFGALVTNCDLDRRRVKGLSTWPGDGTGADDAWLHVSAGAGTSPFAPVRFACRPEATVLTLTARE
ncbi:metallophosphoesterase [Demequina sp.]|uniref:metallophosphoesterase n=1 Tax=Demequina sp. TaxID=2050685 RepID=UPI0025C72528|nr:metallophosphoesterase [Demequina sp.]